MIKMSDKKLNQRINQHYLSDGLMEIIAGGWLILFAIIYLIVFQQELPMFYAQVAMFGLPLAMGPGLRFLKKKFTDQRIGYIKPSRKPNREQTWIVIIAVSLIILLFLISVTVVLLSQAGDKDIASRFFAIVSIIMSGFFALGFFYTAIQYKVSRWFITGIVLVIVGIFIAWLQFHFMVAMFLTLVSSGFIILFGGCVTFVKLLHNNSIDEYL